MECHGADGAGHVVVDDKESGFFVRAPNITAGGASPTRGYTDTDWVRTIRHGVKPSGEPLLVMPSEDYTRMTDAVWIISYGVVALELAAGALVELPADVSDTMGPVGMTTRADARPSSIMDLFMRATRAAAERVRQESVPTTA